MLNAVGDEGVPVRAIAEAIGAHLSLPARSLPAAEYGGMLGHLLSTDSLTLAVGGITTVLALVGGAYGFQIAQSGPLFDIMKGLPSYWLVQAGRTAFGGGVWPAEGWIVIAAWTLVLIPVAALVYRRDTSRA